MNKNKKAIALPWIIGIVAVVLVLFIILFSRGAFASKKITSATTVSQGCTPQDIPVTIKGSGFTKDTAWIGVVAEPDRVTVEEVRGGGTALRAISSQDYTWTAKLYDDFTSNLVAQDGGSNNHPGGSISTEDKFVLNFFVPDNNCDNKIDDFQGNLVYEVRTEDGENKAVSQKISFQGGRYMR